jgi:adhesin transport system outer membrane protein
LTNQVRIAAKFLEMALAERKLGRRSLLDVLTAEVSLINAWSDLVSTEVDADIAALNLMQSIGKLDLESFSLASLESVMPIIEKESF